MSRSRRTERLIAEFFAGVDEVRAYLDRNIQDPERRQKRLGRLVAELPRRSGAHDLGAWLTRRIADALGAKGAALAFAREGFVPVERHGLLQHMPNPVELWRLYPNTSSPLSAARLPGGTVVPLSGGDDRFAVLWIEGGDALDPTSHALVEAIGETAGVMLENVRALESARRDPETGVFRFEVLMERARLEPAMTLIVLRLVGIEEIREARGREGELRAMQMLAASVSRGAPADALLGRDGREILLALHSGGDRQVRAVCTDVFSALDDCGDSALVASACWGAASELGPGFIERARERLLLAKGRSVVEVRSG